MTDTEPDSGTDGAVDGRVARRERNMEAVLDVVMEMFGEDAMFPTIEQASKRSGLSLRSLYRYFSDPGELIDAAIKRHRESTDGLFHLNAIGEGPLDERIAEFVTMRLRGYEGVAAVYRATVYNAVDHARVRDELAKNRAELREQFERQFASELSALRGTRRQSASAAGDVMTQLDTIDLFRRYRQLSVAETESALTAVLTELLDT